MPSLQDTEKVKLTIDIVKANVYGLVAFFPIGILYLLPFFLRWPEKLSKAYIVQVFENTNWWQYSLLILAGFISGIVIHELIHGLTWAIFARKGMRSIRFGVMWKLLTPYCHCKEPLLVKHYITGAVMPAIILGIIPFLISLYTGSVTLLFFALFFTIAAIGDFMIIYLLRNEHPNSYVEDHPSEAGCYVYRGKGGETG